ncbi:hypothetical protein AF335_29820 [Streptomyces eurocidicus]|uniref:Lipoprotein n=1 Tax=Streptomyces eurocidicus TaxID=66423 RepID=A0A2N8NNW9_STREU|nr:DUF3515 domain-containing protein [Streptomyces eurocidicus]MBB5116743.1 hypothetical protein [Streptomyces eurocidicus]MBF6052255.1 DUF3515 family protein [Streptomyces eurocidicus]PNE30454.1 hypothetical protein AF335_29820 [Streptomyces eurocidicus]
MKSSLRRSLALPALLVFCAAGCTSAGGPAGPAVPTPPERAVGLCRALHEKLPDSVAGMRRRTAAPVSDFTAVWGSPAVELRCGVPKPEVITEGNPHYDRNALSVEIDGVEWLAERQPDGSVRCTTTLREANVEVTLPKKVAGEAGDLGALTDLAGAVSATVPIGVV